MGKTQRFLTIVLMFRNFALLNSRDYIDEHKLVFISIATTHIFTVFICTTNSIIKLEH